MYPSMRAFSNSGNLQTSLIGVSEKLKNRPLSARTRNVLKSLPQEYRQGHLLQLSTLPEVLILSKSKGKIFFRWSRRTTPQKPQRGEEMSISACTDSNSSGNATITRLKSVREDVESTLVLTQSILNETSSLLASQFRGMTSRELKSRVKLSFETYDTSKDGVLQPHEVKAALAGLGANLSDTQVLVKGNGQRRVCKKGKREGRGRAVQNDGNMISFQQYCEMHGKDMVLRLEDYERIVMNAVQGKPFEVETDA
ncbi:hypothetical protein GUITHDRAFT_106524 [Guillardia theta CCMP2712]|uniref:EF-hand domain-containing protein n=1 Tax=Guillardia theta (strain CCMP2712) TaxID=905079 RepID=L1JGS5_GUITC|nr:hypothetical protein GUITHDRAFT_106524 [Guillardia theta CCMP2712]EKX47537.1 hypothetical protein GUITHDRAFT_106524 [Guillardia theta CCMP2712]|eukprot:XP_005834517.1 hypothetical protein GUITHDRAFT_106524 [Guillardia theta CCMP2712]